MALSVVTPPTTYPVTLVEAKAHCRVDHTADDTLIDGLIAAAADHIEQYLGRAVMPQTLKLTLDEFTSSIMLPRDPVQSVSSVKYFDSTGTEQTIDPSVYTVDVVTYPGWVVLNSDQTWPTPMTGVNTVSVTYVAGYSTVPASIKHACLLLIGQWYDNRSASSDKTFTELPNAVAALLSNYRTFAM